MKQKSNKLQLIGLVQLVKSLEQERWLFQLGDTSAYDYRYLDGRENGKMGFPTHYICREPYALLNLNCRQFSKFINRYERILTCRIF